MVQFYVSPGEKMMTRSLWIPTILAVGALFLSSTLLAKGTGYIFISSEKDNEVTVLDAKTYDLVKKIETSERPRHMQFNPDRTQIYAACGDGEAIDIISVANLKVVDKIEDIEDPEAFDLSPDGRYMYVSLEDDGALGVIDLKTKEMIRKVEVGEEPEGVLTGADGKTVYVASEVANIVHVIDTTTWESVADIVVGKRPRRFALTPGGRELWVSNELNASVSIIDVASNKVIETVIFQPKGFRPEDVTPVGITMTKGGKVAVVALGRANHVAFVDTASRTVQDYVLVGTRAWNTILSRDNATLIVTNGLSDDISVINMAKRKVLKSVPAGRVPYMALIDD